RLAKLTRSANTFLKKTRPAAAIATKLSQANHDPTRFPAAIDIITETMKVRGSAQRGVPYSISAWQPRQTTAPRGTSLWQKGQVIESIIGEAIPGSRVG